MSSKRMNRQAGSALVYVFVGIVLFAVLSFTFSRGLTNVKSGSASSSNARLNAQNVINYGESLNRAVNKLLQKGISENDLSFANDVMKNAGNVVFNPASQFPNCISDKCNVFKPAGGGVNPNFSLGFTSLPSGAPTWFPRSGVVVAHVIRVKDVGTSAPELIVTYHNMPKEVCQEINNILGVKPATNPPVGPTTGTADSYGGSFSAASPLELGFTAGTSWAAGRSGWCYEFTATTPALYIYQRVVIAR